MSNEAIILVDIQNDFIDGSLGIKSSYKIIPYVNKLIKEENLVIASLDFHPFNHSSFSKFGGKWPAHCIQETEGSKIHKDIKQEYINDFIYKGMDKNTEAYSVFQGKTKDGRSLVDILKNNNIDTLIVAGLALDVCVYETIKDALSMDFKVKIYKNTVEAVENKTKWLVNLQEKGVIIL